MEFGESSVWGKISTVYRRDPQCGGIFLKCKEEILSVGEYFYSVKKRSSVWGNIVKSVKKRSSVLGNISTVYRRDPQCGGKFQQCTEVILSVGEYFYSVQKRSSVWGNISKV